MRKKIVFVVGPGRSGTTVFSKFLGMHSRCFALSEPHYFDAQIRADDYCSCEKKYSQCSFWQLVITRLKEKGVQIEEFVTSGVPFYASNGLIEKIFKNLTLIIYYRFGLSYASRGFFEQIEREAILLETVAESVQEEYIIDASKGFVRALFLQRYLRGKFDFHYIILSRDPRSNVYSKMKTSSNIAFSDGTKVVMDEQGASLEEALRQWNKITRKYILFDRIFGTRAIKVVYELFTQDPKNFFVKKVSDPLGLSWEEKMTDLTSKEHHLMGGNFSRINAKSIHPAKEEWRKLPQGQIDLISTKTRKTFSYFSA